MLPIPAAARTVGSLRWPTNIKLMVCYKKVKTAPIHDGTAVAKVSHRITVLKVEATPSFEWLICISNRIFFYF